jgi:hypothetical protein
MRILAYERHVCPSVIFFFPMQISKSVERHKKRAPCSYYNLSKYVKVLIK